MKRTIFIFSLVMVMLLSSLTTVFATTMIPQYTGTVPAQVVNTIASYSSSTENFVVTYKGTVNDATKGYFYILGYTHNECLPIATANNRTLKPLSFNSANNCLGNTINDRFYVAGQHSIYAIYDCNDKQWDMMKIGDSIDDVQVMGGNKIFYSKTNITDGTDVVFNKTSINPVPVYSSGISIISPSNYANITSDYINLKFVCRVPIQSGNDSSLLSAEITGQRTEAYATTNKSGNTKYYLPRHDGLKPHFKLSDIIDRNSLYYVVSGTISVPNDSTGVSTTLKLKLPVKVESVLGVAVPTWQEYSATLITVYDTTVPDDVGGSTTDTGDPNQPIGDMPDSADYDRTTITGNLDYWGDTILWFISLPFQALAKAASALTDRVSQATQWIGTQDTGVIGFFNIIFSFLPDEVTGLITVLIILFIVICIYRFMRG